jgi:CRISPR/Cas system-associated exonuclease Cas4 (RecB family)
MKENNEEKKQFRISPSKIGDLINCPRCLWLYYRYGIERPEGIFPSLPNGMDGVFKKYFDSYRAVDRTPPEILGKIEGKLFKDTEKLNMWRTRTNGLKAEFKEFNILLKGLIDDLLVTDDNKYIPFDFKTRGYPIKENSHSYYKTQLDLYALLFEKNNMEPADYGYLLFFSPVNYSRNLAKFKTELVKVDVNPQRGYEVLKKTYQIITSELPLPSDDCQYCKYRNLKEDFKKAEES